MEAPLLFLVSQMPRGRWDEDPLRTELGMPEGIAMETGGGGT